MMTIEEVREQLFQDAKKIAKDLNIWGKLEENPQLRPSSIPFKASRKGSEAYKDEIISTVCLLIYMVWDEEEGISLEITPPMVAWYKGGANNYACLLGCGELEEITGKLFLG